VAGVPFCGSDLARFEAKDIAAHRRVNRMFARDLICAAATGRHHLVHDYHLIPLASELRAQRLAERMVFSRTFRCRSRCWPFRSMTGARHVCL
jgi:trehalose-6-phosphate synthase